jgi:hypothetical protein
LVVFGGLRDGALLATSLILTKYGDGLLIRPRPCFSLNQQGNS